MILCCGEALIDMVPNKDGAFAPLAGGSVFNTAIGLGRQGAKVGMFTGVSNDLFGSVLSSELEQSHVATDYLVRSDRPTTLAFVKLVDGHASYAFYDENTAGRMLSVNDLPDTLSEEIDTLFFGGISLAVEPCADTYLEILKRFGADRLVMADPNIRAGFINDERRYRERLDEVLSNADIVKISDEDLDWIDQRSVHISQKIAAIINEGAKLVCLTLGAKGVELYSKDGLIATAQAPEVSVVDTVGAGDTFTAGFLTILQRNGALKKSGIEETENNILEQAISFAARLAADTVTRKGADPAWNFE